MTGLRISMAFKVVIPMIARRQVYHNIARKRKSPAHMISASNPRNNSTVVHNRALSGDKSNKCVRNIDHSSEEIT